VWGQGYEFGGKADSGVRKSVLCRRLWQEYGFRRREEVFAVFYKAIFISLTVFYKTLCKFCTFNATCKDNDRINCIIIQGKEV
jgi:hypothetical protein